MADPREGREPDEGHDVEAHRRLTDDDLSDELERRRRVADDSAPEDEGERDRRRR